MHENELAFWRNETIRSNARDGFKPFFEVAQNALDAYDGRIVTFSGETSCRAFRRCRFQVIPQVTQAI